MSRRPYEVSLGILCGRALSLGTWSVYGGSFCNNVERILGISLTMIVDQTLHDVNRQGLGVS